MRPVQISYGSEGPRHDPYSFQELRVGGVVLHNGDLLVWCKVDGQLVGEGEHARDAFIRAVGVTPESIERALRRLSSRCRKCGCRELDEAAGFPGETLYICVRCGAIVATELNLAAIE
jgi:hypothetical protein